MPEKHKLPVEFRAPASTRENPGCMRATAPAPALVALQSKAKTPVFRPLPHPGTL